MVTSSSSTGFTPRCLFAEDSRLCFLAPADGQRQTATEGKSRPDSSLKRPIAAGFVAWASSLGGPFHSFSALNHFVVTSPMDRTGSISLLGCSQMPVIRSADLLHLTAPLAKTPFCKGVISFSLSSSSCSGCLGGEAEAKSEITPKPQR